MEILLVGNMVLILFWSFMTFISNDTEKYKVIVLIYILTYLVNILNIVPTIESYILLLIALFIYFELFEDHFKKIILKNLIDKLLDFFYRLCAQYAFLTYTLALIISSNYAIDCLGQNTILALYFFSGIFLYLSCSITPKEKYIVSTFDEMKKTIDEKCDYRQFLEITKPLIDPECVLIIEDKNYYFRGERYTIFKQYYLQERYWLKFKKYIITFLKESNKKEYIKQALRGYSTIEMQLQQST